MELALACDFALAADHARFGFPEVTIGVIAGAGGLIRLPRRIGVARAMELLLTGRLIEAAEAAAIGLVARAVPAEGLHDEALRVAQGIAQASPVAVRATLELIDLVAGGGDDRLWQINDDALAQVLAGPDAAEGRRAFREKRAPSFTAA
jgi:enoyl-CoA hydratase/carnithine racemase